jgi:holo-[acyl-carrier protein] synthase
MSNDFPASSLVFPAPSGAHLRVGADTVHMPRIAASLAQFGDRFLARLYSAEEAHYCRAAPSHTVERVAVRFAAKEAVIKALNLAESGVNWRDIEVLRQPDGHCELALHGRAAARARDLGVIDAALSLSHDGDQALAFVVCLLAG